ncbi:MAG: fused MFS/spermidine synthase [Gammaproteobacteria bacterium WSBS_2016_MAG_OTU1]
MNTNVNSSLATEDSTATVGNSDLTAEAVKDVADVTPQSESETIHILPWHYYLIFATSGFATLLYESLWTRYLKIFLGQTAFAQSLVLTLFLVGLALGAMIASRYVSRIGRPLLVYAAIQALLAVIAVYFHDVFVVVQAKALGVLPTLDSSGGGLFKWGVAASLILPQTILLGATFPMLAAGMMRRWSDSPGNTISILYFSNSLGAAIGVLMGGFVLIPTIGLPGVGLTGALINAVIAIVVWIMTRRFGEVSLNELPATNTVDNISTVSATNNVTKTDEESEDFFDSLADKFSAVGKLLLMTAVITGMVSLIYGTIWTRLISFLLGGTTYSFEIMVAIFILGAAIGSFIIRRRADQTAEPLLLLGKVQMAMGALALVSLFSYPWLYKVYANFWPGHGTVDDLIHWRYFLLGGALAGALILPTAICAGMTLPLITRRLMQSQGESAVGKVYAATAVGAILGVYVAVYWLLPSFGVSTAMVIGAACALLVGCVLFVVIRQRTFASIGAFFALFSTAIALVVGGIPLKLAVAGTYRHGTIPSEETKMVFYRDGKTASIAVYKAEEDKLLVITSNGKPNTSILYDNRRYGQDEITATMAGLLPLLVRPDARRAANIGFGSGLTSQTLLQSEKLKQLDNIEIEPLVVAGAKRMGEKVSSVFADQRNHFIYDDARNVLARTSQPYDIIVSSRSTPWVSEVGGVFTREFYQRVKSSLSNDGVFVQWLPFYESSPQIFSSVAGALDEVFSDFQLYLSDSDHVMIVAVAEGKVPPFQNDIFAQSAAKDFLAAYNYKDAADMIPLFLGDKEYLMPYFNSYRSPINSDYFPFVEHQAPLDFYRKSIYTWAVAQDLAVPFMEMANARPPVQARLNAGTWLSGSPLSHRYVRVQNAFAGITVADSPFSQGIARLKTAACGQDTAKQENYMLSLSELIAELMPHASTAQMTQLWSILGEEPCIAERLVKNNESAAALYTRFWHALSTRNSPEIIAVADKLLPYVDLYSESGQLIMLAAMAAHYQENNHHRVLAILNQLPPISQSLQHAARFLGALSAQKL